MALLIPFILRLLPVAALALVLWYGWHRADTWCNSACSDQKEIVQEVGARNKALEEAVAVAQKRATDLALLWAKAIERVEVRYVEVVKERKSTFAAIRERSGRIRTAAASVAVPVPADAVGVLEDSTRAANASAHSAPAGGDREPAPAVPGPADTTLADWIDAWQKAAEAYADAAAKHQACVAYVGEITTKLEEAWPTSPPQP